MVAVTATTRLDAVNRMLSAVGQLPVATVTGSLPADATHALNILNEVDLETQMRGWHFNKELFAIDADGTGRVVIPAGVINAALDQIEHPLLDATIRPEGSDLKVYDLTNHTFVWDLGTTLKVNVVNLIDFEGTPEAFRRYVTTRAARIFMDRTGRSQTGHAITKQDEETAYRLLKKHEGAEQIHTVFDGWAAARVVYRQYPNPY